MPRADWASAFRAQGTADPAPRVEMLDGFNSGWIAFEGRKSEHVRGPTPLATALRELVEPAHGVP